MATKKKLLQAAAGNAGGGAGLDVDDVFSTYLYTGTGSTLNIVNGIDLAGEGGLVWHKYRGGTSDHGLFDTERGVSRKLTSNDTSAQTAAFSGYGITAFNSNGYTLGTPYSGENGNGNEVVSWTFRKAPKFFDVVTYTGDDSGNVVKSHSLGSTPGMIIIKNLSSNTGWDVFHRSTTNGLGTGRLFLNSTSAEDNTSVQFLTADSSSITLTHSIVKTGGENYVAYLFAHNDGDGEFGPDGDADIIKCGSYTGNGSSTGPEIDLGFEPQWLMIKNATDSDPWLIFDAMRGLPVTGTDTVLLANASSSETNDWSGYSLTIEPTATGFKIVSSLGYVNNNNGNYIYMAIRRGPLAPPDSATEVFGIDNNTGQTGMTTGVVTDFGFAGQRSGTDKYYVGTRLLQGSYLNFNSTASESSSTGFSFDQMDGFFSAAGSWNGYIGYGWKRAPGYFDVVAYEGSGVNGNSISHNLTSSPEMIWVKRRDSSADWFVYHTALTSNYYLNLNSASAETFGVRINTPTDTTFNVGSNSGVNAFGGDYIAYLFASLDGISKVGSYTGNGSSQTIDCGFSSGARFVLIKRTDSAGYWNVVDSERGIVAGNDPILLLNETDSEVTIYDFVDPDSSGFIVNNAFDDNNASGGTYIFYAIA